MASISLCVIAGNEAAFLPRFLDSFRDAFDELCICMARGCLEPDESLAIAEKWCADNGKVMRAAIYSNPPHAKDWPHVAHFGDARNKAWDMATSNWLMWADCDDLLAPNGAALIRFAVDDPEAADVIFCTYAIDNTGEIVLRERLFRKGVGRWSNPLHETCLHDPSKHKTATRDKIVFHHRPDFEKKNGRERNRRILKHATSEFDRLAFEMHREQFAEWRASNDEKARKEAKRWGEVARLCPIGDELQFIVRLHQAALAEALPDAKNFAWEAIRLMPWRREGYATLAQLELDAKEPMRALAFTSLLPAMNRPPRSMIPVAQGAYGWEAFDLHIRALRAYGDDDEANKLESEAKPQRNQ
jgi:glycosyltransferase involved in cell wall biosynthesis